MLAEPPTAATKRKADSQNRLGASAQPVLATT